MRGLPNTDWDSTLSPIYPPTQSPTNVARFRWWYSVSGSNTGYRTCVGSNREEEPLFTPGLRYRVSHCLRSYRAPTKGIAFPSGTSSSDTE